ncbi:hypothetical protein B0T10DRAFT_305946 [Thelonectria olida]|uniref:Transmembrane protein n=1 Tax=Thelonectria olida TaxID=1576542 RepID=A0A9P8W930_9HYPO|nr:hypothetical protein B0T10DRAFT_305946 [Thelonectria olida]
MDSLSPCAGCWCVCASPVPLQSRANFQRKGFFSHFFLIAAPVPDHPYSPSPSLFTLRFPSFFLLSFFFFQNQGTSSSISCFFFILPLASRFLLRLAYQLATNLFFFFLSSSALGPWFSLPAPANCIFQHPSLFQHPLLGLGCPSARLRVPLKSVFKRLLYQPQSFCINQT